MGTQQILLIVLSVIIVGIAVAVGITMFNTQAVNSNRDACLADMNNFATQAMAWYRTPASHGGMGSGTVAGTDETALLNWIGFTDGDADLDTGNGAFAATVTANNVEFVATGNEANVAPKLRLTWATGAIQAVASGDLPAAE